MEKSILVGHTSTLADVAFVGAPDETETDLRLSRILAHTQVTETDLGYVVVDGELELAVLIAHTQFKAPPSLVFGLTQPYLSSPVII